jgi:predicted MFS family arabinose efflux permease
VSLIALVPAWLSARAVPDQAQGAVAALTLVDFRRLGATFGSYILFGAGYVSYMTFVIALLRTQNLTPWVPVAFWLVLGVASALSTLIWGPMLQRLRSGRGIAAVSAVAFVGSLPVLLYPGPVAALISAVIFGGSFMAGPTAVTVLCRRALAPHCWTAGIAALTTAFALGQAVGPVISGVLSDGAGGLAAGMWLSPILLVLAAAFALFQAHHVHSQETSA